MLKNCIVSLFLLISFPFLAQPEWSVLENAPVDLGRVDDIFFLNENLGWAAYGPGSSVYKTEDGGQTWTLQLVTPNSYLRNIEFLNENIGFLGTLDSDFYKTTDGGETWQLVSISPAPEAICGLAAAGPTTIYGCGAYFSPAWVIKSTDSGETWEYKDMSAYATKLVEVLFVDEQFGYASGTSALGATILRTTDGGSTWTEIYNSGNPGEYVWKLQLMNNNTTIFGSVESAIQGKLIKSFDSGGTWETKNAPENSIQAVGFVSATKGWMGGHNTGLHETTDGGTTWTNLGIGFSLNRFVFISETLAYCSGNGVYKYEDELSVTDFEETIPTDALEIIIAPMPITHELNIEVSFQHIDNILIELYDMNGKLLEQLTRDKIPSARKKTYRFDFNYPAGTYIVDFHTNNGRRSRTIIKK